MHEPISQNAEFEPREDLDRLQFRAGVAGAAGVVATAVGGFFASTPVELYRAYLVGWLWVAGIALGLFAISMLAHVSGGDWGVVMRRVLEAGGRTLPFFVLAGIPLVFGLEHLYPWVAPEVGADGHYVDHLLEHKRVYLNVNAFLGRALIYFAGWSALAYIISSWSHRYDATGDPAYKEKMKKLCSSPGGR